MSKTISTDLKTEIESGAPNVCTCWKIERTDGVTLGFTDWPESFDYLSLTYNATGGYQRTAMDQSEGLSIDNLDIIGLIDSSHITEDDLLTEKYKNAKVWIFIVSPNNLGWGDIELDYGMIGEVTIHQNNFVAEFRSLMLLLAQDYGSKFSRFCRYQLGESKLSNGVELKCGIVLEPNIWVASTLYSVGDVVSPTTPNGRRFICTVGGTSNDTEGEPTWDTTIGNTTTETDGVQWETYDAYMKYGTVDSVTSRQQFTDTDFSYTAGWFKYGVLTWITGNNAGLSHDIKDSTNTGIFTLRKSTPYDIQVDDQFKVHWGCNHILKMPTDVKGTAYTGDCRAKFKPESSNGNTNNFGGEPELPNIDRITTPASGAK